ncbi:hypothetical protein EJB05_54516, partial [Eragrostis curvula]
MMKAPGAGGALISRAAFLANPKLYFHLLRHAGVQAAVAAFGAERPPISRACNANASTSPPQSPSINHARLAEHHSVRPCTLHQPAARASPSSETTSSARTLLIDAAPPRPSHDEEREGHGRRGSGGAARCGRHRLLLPVARGGPRGCVAMMKAPGAGGLLISRAAFLANPKLYFALLRTAGAAAAAAAFAVAP